MPGARGLVVDGLCEHAGQHHVVETGQASVLFTSVAGGGQVEELAGSQTGRWRCSRRGLIRRAAQRKRIAGAGGD